MASCFTLKFQGEVTAVGGLDDGDERELARLAFPTEPPRDASTQAEYRATKVAPLTSGRLLASVVANRGDLDDYQRPVLRATGCVLDAADLAGALRDLTAVWQVLGNFDLEAGTAAFGERVAALSIYSSPEAFAGFRADLERGAEFHCRLAAALCSGDAVDLYLGDPARGPDLLRPSLGLLPAARLAGLHLAIGSEPSQYREPILGLEGSAPDSARKSGLLDGLLKRGKDKPAVAVDFAGEEVFGSRAKGPQALAEAIADPRPWPLGLADLERYRVLLECLDASEPRSPFVAVPELDDLRTAIRRIEDLSKAIDKWR